MFLVDQHSAKTENIAKCPEADCKASFSTKERMLNHQKKHLESEIPKTGHVRHSCDKCHRSFASRAVMNEHKNMHSGIKLSILNFKINKINYITF